MVQMTPIKDIGKDSDYKDRLLKLIPGEVVATYITIDGIIPPGEAMAKWVALIVALILLLAIPLYMIKIYEVKSWKQIGFTMGAFIVWLYSLGGPFELWTLPSNLPLHVPFIGSILLILWTLLVPIVVTPPANGNGTVPTGDPHPPAGPVAAGSAPRPSSANP
jgi:hypothetical protein